jgi:hypothetical protein
MLSRAPLLPLLPLLLRLLPLLPLLPPSKGEPVESTIPDVAEDPAMPGSDGVRSTAVVPVEVSEVDGVIGSFSVD